MRSELGHQHTHTQSANFSSIGHTSSLFLFCCSCFHCCKVPWKYSESFTSSGKWETSFHYCVSLWSIRRISSWGLMKFHRTAINNQYDPDQGACKPLLSKKAARHINIKPRLSERCHSLCLHCFMFSLPLRGETVLIHSLKHSFMHKKTLSSLPLSLVFPGMVYSEVRRPCRIMVLVNPHSGRGQALQLFTGHVQGMLTEASVPYTLIITGQWRLNTRSPLLPVLFAAFLTFSFGEQAGFFTPRGQRCTSQVLYMMGKYSIFWKNFLLLSFNSQMHHSLWIFAVETPLLMFQA